MIDLVIVVSSPPLVLKVNNRASGNFVDCVVGWIIVVVLRMLLLLCCGGGNRFGSVLAWWL
jgi:hypothetical protein